MKKSIIISIGLLMCCSVFAQQDMLMTQQWFSRINKNPAATGNSDNLDLFFLGRSQWASADDGPQSYLMNAHSYFDGIRSGVGLTFFYDKTGIATSAMDVKLSYAYHVNLKENMLLSLGVSAGALNKQFDPSKHVLIDPENDPDFYYEKVSEWNPDFDFGVELSMPKFLFGASITHLGQMRGKDNENLTTLSVAQQFYLYARGNFMLSPSFDIAPAVVYTNTGKVNMISLGTMLFYKKMFWVGVDYRPPAPSDLGDFDYSALSAMLGVEWNFFRLGYSYDLSLGELNKVSYSTHELMLSFMIPTKKKARVQFVQ